jgi:hypothetical protein
MRSVILCAFRVPADIIHEDARSPGAPSISCALYQQQMGRTLQHPDWPCINILPPGGLGLAVAQYGDGPRAYKSFPLVCC